MASLCGVCLSGTPEDTAGHEVNVSCPVVSELETFPWILWLEPKTLRFHHCNSLQSLSIIWMTLENHMNILSPTALYSKLYHPAMTLTWMQDHMNLPWAVDMVPSMVTISNSNICGLMVYAFVVCLTYRHKEHSNRKLIWRLILFMNIKEPCANVHGFDHWSSLFTFKRAATNKINVLRELYLEGMHVSSSG